MFDKKNSPQVEELFEFIGQQIKESPARVRRSPRGELSDALCIDTVRGRFRTSGHEAYLDNVYLGGDSERVNELFNALRDAWLSCKVGAPVGDPAASAEEPSEKLRLEAEEEEEEEEEETPYGWEEETTSVRDVCTRAEYTDALDAVLERQARDVLQALDKQIRSALHDLGEEHTQDLDVLVDRLHEMAGKPWGLGALHAIADELHVDRYVENSATFPAWSARVLSAIRDLRASTQKKEIK
jgi:hypothetical protein